MVDGRLFPENGWLDNMWSSRPVADEQLFSCCGLGCLADK